MDSVNDVTFAWKDGVNLYTVKFYIQNVFVSHRLKHVYNSRLY